MPPVPRPQKNNCPDPARVEALFERFRLANPAPSTELEYASPFQLLIAVILSAQTTDRAVNLITRSLFSRAPDAASVLALGEKQLTVALNTIGLYKTKSRHIMATCKKLIEHHDGAVPDNREQLEALPGVGRKTANVMLNTAFGAATLAVDTHIFRLAHRIGLSQGKTPLVVEQDLLKLIPERYLKDAHHWLILHGRYICNARKPACWRCSINDICSYQDKSEPPGGQVPVDLSLLHGTKKNPPAARRE